MAGEIPEKETVVDDRVKYESGEAPYAPTK
jgi:hypothetical protein